MSGGFGLLLALLGVGLFLDGAREAPAVRSRLALGAGLWMLLVGSALVLDDRGGGRP